MDNSFSTEHHSAPVKKFNQERRESDPDWQRSLSLLPEQLLAEAKHSTGLSTFADERFVDPMTRLLRSAEAEGDLNPFGRFALRNHTLRMLKNRLWADDYLAKHPHVCQRKITAPIIIIGPHRSGTTRLQRMIATDTRLQHLRAWEGINPSPIPGQADFGAGVRHEEVRRMLDGRKDMYPNAYAAHPMHADWPEEEMLLLNQSFAGFLPLGFYHLPEYYQWFREADKGYAYEYMADLMRIISELRGDAEDKRWILKNPQHLLDLPTLLQTFPDAKLVFTHRDPIKTVGSVLSLMWSYAVQHTDGPCRAKTREIWLDFVEQMARRSMDARAAIPASQQLDIYYHDMNRDWRTVMQRIYDFADLALTTQAQDAMNTWLAQSEEDNRHSGHRYRLEDFGLTVQDVDARMGFVRQQYNIPYE